MLLSDNIRCVLNHKGWGIYSVAPDTFVYDAVQQMADRDIGSLAVISRTGLIGIFSERDYARKIILLGRSSKDTTVREVMSYPARTVTPEESVEDCLRTMTVFRLRHLVVAEEGQAVGVVSIGDLVNWIMSAQEEMIGQLNSYIQGDYPR
jgi:CBS domain-containing protein